MQFPKNNNWHVKSIKDIIKIILKKYALCVCSSLKINFICKSFLSVDILSLLVLIELLFLLCLSLFFSAIQCKMPVNKSDRTLHTISKYISLLSSLNSIFFLLISKA